MKDNFSKSIKLPITDKFLWNIYNLLEKSGNALNIIFPPVPTMKEAIYPEIRKLKRMYGKEKARREFSQFINYLKKQGYIKVRNLKTSQGILLTRKGMKKILKTKFKIQQKKKRRDGKWIMIIFDIPERKRNLRYFLRNTLRFLGYKMLQQSVWVSPYDVLGNTEDFIQRYSFDPYIKIFLIREIEI